MILLVRSRSADSEFVLVSLAGAACFYTPLRFTLWHLGVVGSPRFGERERAPDAPPPFGIKMLHIGDEESRIKLSVDPFCYSRLI